MTRRISQLNQALVCLALAACALTACGRGVTPVRSTRVTLDQLDAGAESHLSSSARLDQGQDESDLQPRGDELDQGREELGLDAELPTDAEPPSEAEDLDLGLEPDAAAPACEPWAATGCERWRRFGEGSSRLAPIMLVHGFFGWGEGNDFDYFYGIPALLNAQGYRVLVAELDAINSSELRSRQLAAQLDEALSCVCEPKLNIIAHSQGGIDARYLLGPHDRADKIESITTISSPHRGFSLADQGARGDELGLEFLETLTALSSELIRGDPERPHDLRATLRSMSIEARQAYDLAWPDPSHVPIYSFAGITNPLADGGRVCDQGERPAPRRGDLIEPALVASYWLLGGFDTPNDGVVPAASCVWGRFLGCIASDHFDQVGQLFGVSDFDYEDFYLNHARFLEEQGH